MSDRNWIRCWAGAKSPAAGAGRCSSISAIRWTDDCGNCDNCLQPPATRDGTEDARKLLSAVYRTGQMFGAAHVVDVLLGKQTPKVIQHDHAELSVFGIGADLPAAVWRSAIRQLVVQGYLRADPDRYGALVLTESSRPVLRGEQGIRLRLDAPVPRVGDAKKAAAQARRRSHPRTARSGTPCATVGNAWPTGTTCRPYVIFHDSTLRQMLAERPADHDELLAISGVGQPN